ncbi:hypothetical protein O988_08079 [Pseudogymnoascus sp. VKM F-3808]|nr:hypothetical protein O988_08079 [Pseudogymnoascus sp. VKM F-3808]
MWTRYEYNKLFTVVPRPVIDVLVVQSPINKYAVDTCGFATLEGQTKNEACSMTVEQTKATTQDFDHQQLGAQISMEALDRLVGIPPPTTWKTVSASILYYSTLPLVKTASAIWNTVLVVSAPLIHLVTYITHVLLIPLSLFGNLETFYIYFGVASIIGLLAGGVVYSISTIMVSVLGLKPTPTQQTPRTIRESQYGQQQEGTRRLRGAAPKGRITSGYEESPWYGEPLTRENVGYFDKGRKARGLSSQIIPEEDSGSDL